MKADPIAMVEAAYDLETSERDWMLRLLECAIPLVPGACRGTAYRLDVSDTATPAVGRPVNVGYGPRFNRLLHEAMNADGPTVLKVTFPKVSTLTETLGPDLDGTPFGAFVTRNGARDVFGCVALDAERRGLVVATDLSGPTRLSRAARTRWLLIGSHLAAARRLRDARTRRPETDCVLAPGGRVLHAQGEATLRAARERLREAVVARDSARTRASRAEPDAALARWSGLVSGRWSLVDQFERDGRRFIVARRNDPRPPDPLALTLRERQVFGHMVQGDSVKLTAYALGLSASTVSSLASSVRLKIGVRNVAEVVARLQPGAR
jgi:DNA-binding CsgD family transcriptional regulator